MIHVPAQKGDFHISSCVKTKQTRGEHWRAVGIRELVYRQSHLCYWTALPKKKLHFMKWDSERREGRHRKLDKNVMLRASDLPWSTKQRNGPCTNASRKEPKVCPSSYHFTDFSKHILLKQQWVGASTKEFNITKISIKAIPLMKGELWICIQNFNKMSHLTQLHRNILHYFFLRHKILLSIHQSFTVGMQLPAKVCVFPCHISNTFPQKTTQYETFLIVCNVAAFFICIKSQQVWTTCWQKK